MSEPTEPTTEAGRRLLGEWPWYGAAMTDMRALILAIEREAVEHYLSEERIAEALNRVGVQIGTPLPIYSEPRRVARALLAALIGSPKETPK